MINYHLDRGRSTRGPSPSKNGKLTISKSKSSHIVFKLIGLNPYYEADEVPLTRVQHSAYQGGRNNNPSISNQALAH